MDCKKCIQGNTRRIVFLLLFYTMLFPFHVETCRAQDRAEIGGFVGTSYYVGDLNPGTPFRNPHLAIGGIGRYMLNDRFALKGSVIMGDISGEYPVGKVLLNETRTQTYRFRKTLLDVAVMTEINFFSYDHPYISTSVFTPYVTFGVASTTYRRTETVSQGGDEKTAIVLSLPFGAGVKYKLTDWIRVGFEWTYRKTFVDDLDLAEADPSVNPADPFGFGKADKVHNNDWYSFAGIYVTFNMFHRKSQCNAGFKKEK